ncbi:beta-ketoacyl synthase chain length factor [Gilvimarinus chinensis]|uniref:beta-ketoacyl synthase chain length factor n=1 Tax=Gilvimarinus chinensis TaxID=396005 RepID=UPI0003601FC9|nr:beta-ketoacyl synthase chain length factor [Gilvimarinus chinensis]
MQIWLTHCNAWAPGYSDVEQWREFTVQSLPAGDEKPAASGVPAILRRRLTRWGRQAFEVAEQFGTDWPDSAPVIFSSRHGDTGRTFKLLQSLANNEPLSPNGFSLSVHNSALGLFSIIKKLQAPTVAMAGGRDTLACAWQEAVSWLRDGAEKVLLIHSEEPLASLYQGYADEREMPAALAVVLATKPLTGSCPVELVCHPGPSSMPDSASQMVGFLDWWFGDAPQWQSHTSRHVWEWRRGSACV